MCADLAFAAAPIGPGSGKSGDARTVFDRWVSSLSAEAAERGSLGTRTLP
jgi:hypothetical protein